MISFQLWGLRVELHWSFLLLLGLSAGWPPLRVGLGAALCHELAHLAAMGAAGIAPAHFRLGLTGGRLRGRGAACLRAELLSVLAGPACNLLLAAAFRTAPAESLRLFSAVNLVLGVFNLLPVQGLDGGRALRLFLERKAPGRGTGFCTLLSLLTLGLLWVWCLWLWRRHPHLPTLMLLPAVPASAFLKWRKNG